MESDVKNGRITKYLTICLLSAAVVGVTIYIYCWARRRESDETDNKVDSCSVSDQSIDESSEYDISSITESLCDDEDICTEFQYAGKEEKESTESDPYLSASSVLSSSTSSTETFSSEISLTESTTSTIDTGYSNKRTICGIELEDNIYSNHVTPQTFEAQLNSPVIVPHAGTGFSSSLLNTDYHDMESKVVAKPVSEYSDSLKTIQRNMDQYRMIIKPNSPSTVQYIM
ncbi:unnamed protein product [Mytilus coruscus]|uniref:Uncharacterized protein n=1 Tax=Mytilus coruscus TaxID=42192 RepID=A0A6J8AU07_MYTCO|nr:unnamed protein product [Mytilus coruscus]